MPRVVVFDKETVTRHSLLCLLHCSSREVREKDARLFRHFTKRVLIGETPEDVFALVALSLWSE